MENSFISVTEAPGIKASREQLERLYQRYHFALQFCDDKDVLEIACGAGQGLGYLAKTAKKVVGSDIDENNLKFAKQRYRKRTNVKVECFDAHEIPFADNSFDVVLLYEAIYYFQEPKKLIKEISRVLQKNGVFIICSVNKDWVDFNPSPFSQRYFSAMELAEILKVDFDKVDLYGGFSVAEKGIKDVVISLIKRTAVKLNLMPKTMETKELLKRIFFGKLSFLPAEVTQDMQEYKSPVILDSSCDNSLFKVIFAIARK